MDHEPQASQPSSVPPPVPAPICGSTLYELEGARREELQRAGTFRTGCREIDEQVLVDGLERGSVVGISAEELDFGLLVSSVSSGRIGGFGPGKIGLLMGFKGRLTDHSARSGLWPRAGGPPCLA